MPRAEVVSREDPQDALALDEETLDPDKHYRFCAQRNIGRRKAQGYEVVLRSDTGVRLLNEDDAVKSSDDLIRVGDLVLMACSKARFKERRKKLRELTRGRLGSVEQNFKERARKRGAQPLIDNEGERK